MRTFRVKNFETFQHYKDRAPPWIKLYNELLDDYEFGLLPDAAKMHLVAIWLLASRCENKIPFDAAWVARRINATEKVNLTLLADRGFILLDQELQTTEQVASTPLAKCLSREREEGEAERETEQSRKVSRAPALDDWPENFGDLFWQAYPRRTEKLAAMKKLETVRKSGIVSWADLIAGVQRYARAVAGTEEKFIKQPTVWLNKGCWSDEIKTGGDHGNRNSNPRSTGHDAILAAATRKAERLAGDGELARTGAAPEFSDRNGINGGRAGGFAEANGRPCGADDGLEPRTGTVLEGEIIAPDKAAAGQRDGRLI